MYDVLKTLIFSKPRKIVESSGILYTATYGDDTLHIIDGECHKRIKHDKLKKPRGVVIVSNYVYVTCYETNSVVVFDSIGNYIMSFGSDVLSHPRGIDYYEDEIFVTDVSNNRVCVFSMYGEYKRSFGNLSCPRGISISCDGLVYVADSGNHDIKVYTRSGEYLKTIGEGGIRLGEFHSPNDVYVDKKCLYVSEWYGRRIQVYDLADNSFRKVLCPENCGHLTMISVTSDGYVLVGDDDSNCYHTFCNTDINDTNIL